MFCFPVTDYQKKSCQVTAHISVFIMKKKAVPVWCHQNIQQWFASVDSENHILLMK
jgi:hypothetical protein